MAKPDAPGHAGPNHDPGFVLLLGVALVGLALWLLWRYFHTEISTVVLAVKGAQAAALSLVTGQLDLIRNWIATTHPSRVSAEQLLYVSEAVGSVYSLPVTALLGALALWAVARSPTERYRRRFDMDRLLAEQSREWGIVANAVGQTPHSRAPRPYEAPLVDDPALYPHEWLRAYAMPKNESGERVLSSDAVLAALTAQLGDTWTEPKAAAPHARVLFAAFALKAAHKGEQARAILVAAARSYGPKGGALSEEAIAMADAAIADEKATARARKAAARHAYVTGALRAALQAARDRDGVLASAEFTWLKRVDRSLWYALNGLGRATAWPECAGAVAHWAMERAAGRPIDTPCIDAAVIAFEPHGARAAQPDVDAD